MAVEHEEIRKQEAFSPLAVREVLCKLSRGELLATVVLSRGPCMLYYKHPWQNLLNGEIVARLLWVQPRKNSHLILYAKAIDVTGSSDEATTIDLLKLM